MKLATLIQDLLEARVLGDVATAVRAVEEDSRRIGPGDVFVAVRGRRSDGHQYLAQVIEQGAVAVVVEQPIADPALAGRVTQVVVPSTARALGVLAAAMAGKPGERLGLVGITGTNGKTTTAYLTEAVLGAAGAAPGVIGTVSYRYGDVVVPAPYTTPTAPVLQGVLADMDRAGCTHAVLEVSSAALAMDRLAGVRFRVAAFTNFTQDHLDVHGSMAAYLEAKQRLFRDHLAPDGAAVINVDDDAAPAMIAATIAGGARRILRVSARGREDAEVRVIEAETSIDGIRATLATPRGPVTVESRALLGHYNIANLAVTVGIGEALGLDQAAVARGIAAMPGVPGRVERVPNPAGLDILVDYAHTPDAIDNVLAALRPLTRRRLLCVFGCGGDRDPDKRPKMGAAAAAGADLVIVTSDNPRSEEPEAIIEQILPGVPAPFFVHVDRRVAIAAAVFEAVPGDIVLIAGKGHENYQILGAEKVHFDDREEAVRAAHARWRFPADELARVAEGTITQRPAREPAPAFTRVILDGRDTAPGDLYVAIRGDRFDGHDFCAQAVQAGAAGVVVERGRAPRDANGAVLDTTVIEVEDTRLAMGAMAKWHRRRWAEAPRYADAVQAGVLPGFRPVVGITGSAGKTTTKELIAAALSARHVVQATRGSLNNETGVPLTLLGLMPHHDAAVIEMGMRGLGQIAYLAQLAEPAVAAVLNAGTAHVGVVGSTDAIAQGKSEIFAALGEGGTAVFPAADVRLAGHAVRAPRRLRFAGLDHDAGTTPPPEVAAVDYALVHLEGGTLGAEVSFVLQGGALLADGSDRADRVDRVRARLALVGRHNATNAACALACAIAAGVPAAAAARALSRARPPALRGQIRMIAGRHVLIDCYNANPASMRVALATVDELAHTHGGRAIAVLGDMLELGDEAATAHVEVGRGAAGRGVAVVAVGEHAPALAGESANCVSIAGTPVTAREVEAAAAAALARTAAGDWILIKASRGMRLERVIEAMQRLAANHIDTPSREG
jgi:murE/murF fusion protein